MREETGFQEPPFSTGATILCSDLAFFPLDDELVLFCPSSQKLLGLNATAAFLVGEMRRGASRVALAGRLMEKFGISATDAPNWVSGTIEALQSHGFLDTGDATSGPPPSRSGQSGTVDPDPTIPPLVEPFEPRAIGCYRLLNTYALIRCSHPAQLRMIDAVIGHLKAKEAVSPTLIIDVQGTAWGDRQMASNIYRNGVPEAQAERLSALGPLVKSLLWLAGVNSADFVMNLHAGVVGDNGRCVLLPAAAGSGKSSLTAALTHSGLGYYSDEVALVDRATFQVWPVPLAICVKSTGWEVIGRYFPQVADLPTHWRGDGKIVRYVPPPQAAIQRAPAKASHIFFPSYDKDARTHLQPLSRSAALARLMDQCVALSCKLDTKNAGELVHWIGAIECYLLPFSSLDEAVALVRQTAFS